MLGLEPNTVRLLPHQDDWARLFEEEKAIIIEAIGPHILDIQHVGSTAIPGIPAKPIIDIGIAVQNFEEAAICIDPIVQLGYVYRGENGIPRRHYFRKGSPVRTHHLHLNEIDGPDWQNQILFRDYLRQHPEAAAEYGRLKTNIAQQHPTDREAYLAAKAPFIESILRLAQKEKEQMFNIPQKIILISGAPGVGKTTIAIPLARALNFALITKDDIKETLYEALDGRPNDREFSRKVGAASWELLWKLASKSPQVILESNFRPNSQVEIKRLAAFDAQIIEVHCYCSPKEIMRRFKNRSAVGDRHYAHTMSEITAEQVAEFDGWMGFGRLIELDTTHPVDIPALAQQINNLWQ